MSFDGEVYLDQRVSYSTTAPDADAVKLANAVRQQLREHLGHVERHAPLRVRWHHVTDGFTHWANIAGRSRKGPPQPSTVDDLTGVYTTGIPSPRLVILGQAGSGKTVAAAGIAASLLGNDPVSVPGRIPALVDAATWDPHTTGLTAWLTDCLHRTYLPTVDNGHEVAERLVTANRLLPIIDGLDEMSPAGQAK